MKIGIIGAGPIGGTLPVDGIHGFDHGLHALDAGFHPLDGAALLHCLHHALAHALHAATPALRCFGIAVPSFDLGVGDVEFALKIGETPSTMRLANPMHEVQIRQHVSSQTFTGLRPCMSPRERSF